MLRTLEPEIMDDGEQSLAYANANFSTSNQWFVDHLLADYPEALHNVVDIGCGPCDVMLRLADVFRNIDNRVLIARGLWLNSGLFYKVPFEQHPREYGESLSRLFQKHDVQYSVLNKRIETFGLGSDLISFPRELWFGPSDEEYRENLLMLARGTPESVKKHIWHLMTRYVGHDRFYLAAIGIAVGSDPKRREIILADFDKEFPGWNDEVADLVWELRPPVMMPKLVSMLGEPMVTDKQRARIVDTLATQDAGFGRELLRARNEEPSAAVRERIMGHVEHFISGKWRELRPSPELTTLIDAMLSKPETTARGLALIAEARRDDLTSRVAQIGSSDAIKTLGSLGNVEAIAALVQTLAGGGSNRTAALNALVASRRGSQWLIENKSRLPADLLHEAGRLLRNTPYQDLRQQAFAAFPPAAKLDMAKLPEIAVLAKKRGDVERGKAILAASVNNDAACLKCHTVNGAGGQIGPDLSTIGTKASRENLIESILYPSKAIADQFVNWQVMTKKGVALGGLLIEETADAIVIRDANGKDTRLAKNEIESREKSPNSLMPDDNAKTLTEEELVDLVEYLMTLKKGA
jgi:putative heme-binding domain-containing protein